MFCMLSHLICVFLFIFLIPFSAIPPDIFTSTISPPLPIKKNPPVFIFGQNLKTPPGFFGGGYICTKNSDCPNVKCMFPNTVPPFFNKKFGCTQFFYTKFVRSIARMSKNDKLWYFPHLALIVCDRWGLYLCGISRPPGVLCLRVGWILEGFHFGGFTLHF